MARRREREAPEVTAAAVRMMRALVKRAGDGELEALEGLVSLQAALDGCLDQAVHGYREGPAKASWAAVGEAVGVSRQAAQQRFGRTEVA